MPSGPAGPVSTLVATSVDPLADPCADPARTPAVIPTAAAARASATATHNLILRRRSARRWAARNSADRCRAESLRGGGVDGAAFAIPGVDVRLRRRPREGLRAAIHYGLH